MNLLITCPPGLAQICKQELKYLGYNGQVIAPTSLLVQNTIASDMITLNLRLRTANKIFLILDRSQINTFDELFDFVSKQERSHWIQNQQPILVEASSHKSQLTSLPTIQSVVKKAVTSKLTGDKELMRTENKWMIEFALTLMLHENVALLLLNTSGDSLHRRGYRTETGDAPIKENIAAWLILDSGWRFKNPFYDICCGSGTICIEAALIAKNIAPWLLRTFSFQSRKGYNSTLFDELKAEAKAKEIDKAHIILGSDLDELMIIKAKINAKNAGIADDAINFQIKDCKSYNNLFFEANCSLISNPPYGQRMQSSDIGEIHEHLFWLFEESDFIVSWGIITGYSQVRPNNHRIREEKKLKNGAEEVLWRKRRM